MTARHRFRNNLWEIDLLIEQKQKGRRGTISGLSTIKNLHPAKRVVPLTAGPDSGGLDFILKQGNNTFPFRIDGEPLAYEAFTAIRKSSPVDSIDLSQPFELMQEFKWANSPVKRILDIQLGKHAHRTANMPFLPSLLIKPVNEDDGSADAAGAPWWCISRRWRPEPPGGAAKPGDGSGVREPELSARSSTPPLCFRDPTVRHLPVAMLLIVDQTHMHEVLVAMSNSRLRVQTTQVQFHHVGGITLRKLLLLELVAQETSFRIRICSEEIPGQLLLNPKTIRTWSASRLRYRQSL